MQKCTPGVLSPTRLAFMWEYDSPPPLDFRIHYPSTNTFDCCFILGVLFEYCCVIVCMLAPNKITEVTNTAKTIPILASLHG